MEQNNEAYKMVVTIQGQLNEETGFEAVEQICSTFSEPNITQIVLIIASFGGSVDTVTPILETLKMSGKEIVTIGMQHVASAATTIFMAGDRRILFPNTTFLIHESSLRNIEGMAQSVLENAAKDAKGKTELIWQPVIEKTSLTRRLIKSRCDGGRDWYLTDEEIAKYGIITEPYDREAVKELLS